MHCFFYKFTMQNLGEYLRLLRKEVIHPHLPVGIPCYDLVLITDLALGNSSSDQSKLRKSTSGAADFAGLTGSVYKI